MLRRIAVVVGVLSVVGGIWMEKSASAASSSTGFDHSVRLGQISVLQKNGSTFSGIATWVPSYGFGSFGVKLDLGASYFKSRIRKQERFFVFNARGLVEFALGGSSAIEVGGGTQYWVDNGDFLGLVGLNYVHQAGGGGLIREYFIGYNYLPIKNLGTHEIIVGVGLF